ncbi:hypothetical protein [uncultured Microbacterium sp.]|uniref:hypothetical protein n=1 Tax=uncultured Microbacterium sp. TaxID=191216 RepID=UPI00260682B5|nr:hypothetical protein [uncultured Microbacterium sp.]
MRTPSAVRVDVTVADHPEYDRTLELPSDAPRSWLAEAYLMSVGYEPPSEMESGDEERWAYPEARWDPYGQVTRQTEEERRLHLPSFPHEAVMRKGYPYDATLGDQSVAVLDAERGTALGQPASAEWQTAAPPFRIDRVNEELARKYGIVLPYFSRSSLDGVERGIRPSSLIRSLFSRLTPVRRLALHAHLEDGGMLDNVALAQADALSATEAVRTLLHRVGDGVAQDAESGWLPTAFTADLAGDLGWKAADVDALVSLVREARMLRRLRGEVIVTALGKKLLTEPARGASAVTDFVAMGNRRSYSYTSRALPHFETAAALLAIADGSALTLADLPGLVAAVSSREDRDREDRWDGCMFGGASDAGTIDAQMEILAERLRMLSAPGAYGEISPAMRAVARAALM